ncbi:MAG TPA: BON domain-containing protein [Chthonomonadaceae bacterium]|nr:BON domain-containing protein [Chthonomonadaceae bacterium]
MITLAPKTDAAVLSEVVQELRWDCRTETSPITVSVRDGRVTLAGRAKYFAVKRAAEDAARRIAGVTAVDNQINVWIPANEYSDDCEVADAVRNAFACNVLIPNEAVSVLVDDGIVTLMGAVECLSQREEAEAAVVNLLGVRGIVNRIAVKVKPVEATTVCDGIKDSLERQAVATPEQVGVEVDHAAVRLTGTVPTYGHRRAAVTAAAFAPGVRRVVDDLRVA